MELNCNLLTVEFVHGIRYTLNSGYVKALDFLLG
ncbi:MAG: hypothetical protein K0Q56_1100 [Sporolactobacillus laevolacticus]|jgi:hypothetical protein|nr:hypothetical protein [Sporolactobacillus laevolacticus]